MLDTLDVALLRALRDNPRVGVLELARLTGVARATVSNGLRQIAFLDSEIKAVEKLIAQQALSWPEIRRLMTDRPHTFTIRSSDDRRLAATLLADATVFGIEITPAGIVVRTTDRGAMARNLARVARDASIRLLEIRPTDESLESVFSYLVDR